MAFFKQRCLAPDKLPDKDQTWSAKTPKRSTNTIRCVVWRVCQVTTVRCQIVIVLSGGVYLVTPTPDKADEKADESNVREVGKEVQMGKPAGRQFGKPVRKKKADRLLHSQQSADAIRCDYALAPFDEMAREMDWKWGVDRLVELVSVETATKFGSAMAKLNDAILDGDPEMVAARVSVCMRGMVAMDAEATAAGKEPASDDVWVIEADGYRFGLMKDGRAWQRAQERFPGVELITEREMVMALNAYKQTVVHEMVKAIKQNFPAAEVIRSDTLTGTTRVKIAKEALEDEIPW